MVIASHLCYAEYDREDVAVHRQCCIHSARHAPKISCNSHLTRVGRISHGLGRSPIIFAAYNSEIAQDSSRVEFVLALISEEYCCNF